MPAPASPKPARRVVVAGLGLVTPVGHSAWQTFAALLAGRRITDRIDQLEHDTQPVPLAQAVGGVSCVRHTATDPTVELAERAAREAATEAGRSTMGLPTWIGTSKGAVGAMSDWTVQRSPDGVTEVPHRLVEAVALGTHGYLSHHLAQRTGIDVRCHTVAACASSLTALDQARRALLNRQDSADSGAKYALVVTSEAALLPAFIHSYRRLGVLSPLTLEGYRQVPLDESRSGFVLAEVGAAVLLRVLDEGQLPAARQIELVDTAVATDPYDLIRPSPDMVGLRHVLDQLVRGRRFAAVHPHATGTIDHDPREQGVVTDALIAAGHPVDGVEAPGVYAYKGALGHSLGSAGLVSLVLACLSARSRRLPPMPWIERPVKGGRLPLTPLPQVHDAGGAHLVVSSGFGGQVAGAVVRPWG